MNNWSEKEDSMLLEYYQDTPSDKFSVDEIAIIIGRSVNAISNRASKLGVRRSGRKKNAQTKARMKKAQLELCKNPDHLDRLKKQARDFSQNNEHPRGMKGKAHSAETKLIISEESKKRWADPKSKFNTEEYRQMLSDNSSQARIRELRQGKSNLHTNARGGRRPDLDNRYFRSGWEANIARYLNFLVSHNEIHRWQYEPDTFWFEKIKRGTRSYTPDFKIWDKEDADPYYWEVKGYMDKKSQTKLKRMAKYYPSVTIELVDSTRYKAIKKTASSIIDNWE